MLVRRTVRIGIFLVLCLFATPLQAQEKTIQKLREVLAETSLQENVRLQTKVSLEETGISLQSLLQKLSRTNLQLQCTDICAPQKLQIRLKERPLFALMQALAQLIPGQWEPLEKQQGYRFLMSEKSRRDRENWWHLYWGERQRIFEALKGNVLHAMRVKPNLAALDFHPDLSKEIVEYETRSRQFFPLLSSSLQEQIAAQITETAFYRAGSRYLATYPEEGGLIVRMQDLPPEAQNIAYACVPGDATPSSLVHFSNQGFHVIARIVTKQGGWPCISSLSLPLYPQAVVLPLDHEELVKLASYDEKRLPEAWKRLLAYQKRTFWRNDPSLEHPQQTPPPRRTEVLRWLATQANIEYVSDYYTRVGNLAKLAERNRPLTRPLKAELDYRAVEQDMSWRQRSDGLYLFRNNRWYRDDLLEVPNPLLSQWLPALSPSKRNSKPGERERQQLTLVTEMLQNLTPWQIANGLTYFVDERYSKQFDPEKPTNPWRPFVYLAETALLCHRTLTFYSQLSPELRSQLLQGRLPFRSLTASQRATVVSIKPEWLAFAGTDTFGIFLGLEFATPAAWGFSGYYSPPQKEPPWIVRLVLNTHTQPREAP